MSKIKKMLLVVLAVVIVSLLALTVAVAGRSKQGIKYVYRDDSDTVEVADRAKSINILFLGTDREAGLCDVIMLINVDLSTDRATVAQIPRDTYAAYTDASYKKLNGAYTSLGGAEQVADFLGDAMGVRIDHYVCIGLDTLGDIVDAMDGVDIELPCDMVYSDPAQGLYIDLEKGLCHLDGELAEQFVRFRSDYINGDLGRLDAQKLFMAAVFQKLSDSFSPIMAAKLSAAAEGVETDMSIADMLSVGVQALDMDGQSISMVTLPGEEATATQSGACYYVLSRAACEEIMEEYFGASADFDTEERFLNGKYDSFERIYNGYKQYAVTPVTDIARSGVDLKLK